MTVISKETLWDGKFLRTVLVRYSLPGSPDVVREWEAMERVGCAGIAAIVPITDRDEVVLIRQFRPPIGGFVVELPAGLCEQGEDLESAAQRELIQETGYAAGSLHFLAEGPMSPGASSEILSVFAASGLSYVGVRDRDETEEIEVLKVPLRTLNDKLAEMHGQGDHIDLKVYGLVELAKDFLQRGKRSSGSSGD